MCWRARSVDRERRELRLQRRDRAGGAVAASNRVTETEGRGFAKRLYGC
jgi:hypothetical protein